MKISEYEVKITSNQTAMVGCTSVKLDEVEALAKAIREWKPEPKLKVGDYVKALNAGQNGGQGVIGKFGKIVFVYTYDEAEPPSFAVEFAEPVTEHRCQVSQLPEIDTVVLEKIPKHHAAWFDEGDLEKV